MFQHSRLGISLWYYEAIPSYNLPHCVTSLLAYQHLLLNPYVVFLMWLWTLLSSTFSPWVQEHCWQRWTSGMLSAFYQFIRLTAISWQWAGTGTYSLTPVFYLGYDQLLNLFNILADLLSWILEKKGLLPLIHYLDDFFTMGQADSAAYQNHLTTIKEVCQDLSISLALEKLEGPPQCLTLSMSSRIPNTWKQGSIGQAIMHPESTVTATHLPGIHNNTADMLSRDISKKCLIAHP